MSQPLPFDVKQLKKLAATCRKAGIINFKCMKDGSFEFELDPNHVPEVPLSKLSQRTEQKASVQGPIESDGLTEEQLLMWSTGGMESVDRDGETAQ